MSAIVPKKKPIRGVLSQKDVLFNRKHSSDRILVENYFRRMCQLWSLLSAKFVLPESMYGTVFALGVTFINYHMTAHKLRSEECSWYNGHGNGLSGIGEEGNREESESDSKYRRNRRQRLKIGFRNTVVGSDDDTIEEVIDQSTLTRPDKFVDSFIVA